MPCIRRSLSNSPKPESPSSSINRLLSTPAQRQLVKPSSQADYYTQDPSETSQVHNGSDRESNTRWWRHLPWQGISQVSSLSHKFASYGKRTLADALIEARSLHMSIPCRATSIMDKAATTLEEIPLPTLSNSNSKRRNGKDQGNRRASTRKVLYGSSGVDRGGSDELLG